MSVRTEKLNYIYAPGTGYEVHALKDIDLRVEAGEYVGIIGRTGSGKSTLLQHLNGLVKPSSGTVYYNDEDIFRKGYDLKKLRQKVGLVFQYPEYQLFETSIFKDVCFGPKNMGLSEEERRDRAAKALTTVGLPESEWEKSPFDISGGERRRAAIAGVFAMEPEVLVLDEPTAGLDPEGRKEIFAAIDKMRELTGAAIILVSHSMEDVAEHADRVVVMEDGRIVMDGPVREIFARREELEKMSLRAPEAAYLMDKLRDAGLPVKTGIVTSKEAEEEILRLFGRQ